MSGPRRAKPPAPPCPGPPTPRGTPADGPSSRWTLLAEQAETRVPELVPIRYGRMAASSFAYYRGAALPMAADLATMPHSDLTVQLCGDAHLSNFGGFASPEREMLFDVNDFDETLPGPFEWDVKRLAAQPGGGRPGPGVRSGHRPQHRPRWRAVLPGVDPDVRGHDQPGRLVRPAGCRRGDQPMGRHRGQEGEPRSSSATSPRPRPRTSSKPGPT